MSRFSDFWRHTAALTVKEVRQIVRDKSAFLLGIVMPVTLILLFGYGITFDDAREDPHRRRGAFKGLYGRRTPCDED